MTRDKHDMETLRSARLDLIAKVQYGQYWRHVKSGHHYMIQTVVVIESTLELAVAYRRVGDVIVWVRPASEFLDGRFVRMERGEAECP